MQAAGRAITNHIRQKSRGGGAKGRRRCFFDFRIDAFGIRGMRLRESLSERELQCALNPAPIELYTLEP